MERGLCLLKGEHARVESRQWIQVLAHYDGPSVKKPRDAKQSPAKRPGVSPAWEQLELL